MTAQVMIFLFCSLLPAEAEHTAFNMGNTLYLGGAFEAALEAYESAAGEVRENPGCLYYNQGCCFFKLGRYGEALHRFYTARMHLPREERIARNLEVTEARLGLKACPVLSPGPAGTAWLRDFTTAEYLLAAGYLLCAALLFQVPRLIWGSRRLGRLSLFCFCLVLVMAGLSFFAASDRLADRGVALRACEALTEPSPAAGATAFLLREGEGVYTTTARNGWVRIESGQGETGWVREGEVLSLGATEE
jgi:tetratricopeptide (TPR) repeat protein